MSDDGLAPGKRLSEIRQQLGLSQRRAAELSGLTHSAISTIEQDKVSPAISTLQKLLKVYGLSLSEFFAEPEKPDEPQVVINQDDLIEIGSQGVSMKLVHNGNPNRTLAMMFETYQPGTTTGERIKHQGEEIGTILEGEVILTVNGQEVWEKAAKDYAQGVRAPVFYSSGSEAPKNNAVTSNVDTHSYKASDEKLNSVWKSLSPETRKRLLPSQREWIKHKSGCNNEQKCLTDMTNNRIRELESENGK